MTRRKSHEPRVGRGYGRAAGRGDADVTDRITAPLLPRYCPRTVPRPFRYCPAGRPKASRGSTMRSRSPNKAARSGRS